MAVYVWHAKGRKSEARTGEIEASDIKAATDKVRSQGLFVTRVALKKAPVNVNISISFGSGVSTKDLVVFTRQFATMINAGLPLVQCLDLLGNQSSSPKLKTAIMDIKNTVEGGKTLAEGLKRHPKIFNRLYVNLVAAGEASGMLDGILGRLSVHIEKNMKLMKKVRGAMVYPGLTLAVASVVTMVLLIWVIPVFQKMFAESGNALPAITQFVIDLSAFVRANILYMLAGLGSIVWTFKKLIASSRGRRLFDRALLYVPVVSPLVRKVAVAKFTRTLGTMLSSGVNILEALDIVAGTAGNVVVEEGLLRVREKISEGVPMAKPLADIPVFPAMVVQMIAVGEQTGAVDSMLIKIADFYDDEVDSAIATMMALFEPIIMSLLAIVLGGLVISMYLPIFSMAANSGGG